MLREQGNAHGEIFPPFRVVVVVVVAAAAVGLSPPRDFHRSHRSHWFVVAVVEL